MNAWSNGPETARPEDDDTPQPERLLTVREAADVLGCSFQNVYEKINRGSLTPVRRRNGSYGLTITQLRAYRAWRRLAHKGHAPTDEELTVSQVAIAVGTTVSRIYQQIWHQTLRAHKYGYRWFVWRKDLPTRHDDTTF